MFLLVSLLCLLRLPRNKYFFIKTSICTKQAALYIHVDLSSIQWNFLVDKCLQTHLHTSCYKQNIVETCSRFSHKLPPHEKSWKVTLQALKGAVKCEGFVLSKSKAALALIWLAQSWVVAKWNFTLYGLLDVMWKTKKLASRTFIHDRHVFKAQAICSFDKR